MIVPEIAEAEKMLAEAERQNPGEWVSHNRVAGQCAKTIAENCDDLNPDTAYVLGLLHDIGRRFGACDLRHILLGYTYMAGLGFDDSARICLTHSFPYKDMAAYNGQNDCSDEESSLSAATSKVLPIRITTFSFSSATRFPIRPGRYSWKSGLSTSFYAKNSTS